MPNTRIVIVDCLRGFALMGLFMVHMVEYFELYWYRPDPHWVFDTVFFLFGGKAYAIFSLLFGLSFFIIMDNQAAKGIDFRPRFAWRLTTLLLIGVLHSLLYSGDILQVLALSGFLLIAIYNLHSRWILLLAIACLMQLPMLVQLQVGPLSETFLNQVLDWDQIRANGRIYATGSLIEVLAQNATHGQAAKWLFMVETGRIWNVIGLFLIGFLLGRVNYFKHFQSLNRSNLVALVSAGAGIGICYFALANAGSLHVSEDILRTLNQVITHYLNSFLTLAGVVLFVFAYQVNVLRRIMNTLAPCGRMTLTMYLAQSLIGVPLFYGFGLGLYDKIGQEAALMLGIALWLVQMLVAHFWFRRYYYGPVEWVWRVAVFLSTDVRWKRV